MNNKNRNGVLFPAHSSLGRNVLWIAFVALLYFIVARLSLLLVFQPESIAAIWPPAGIFLSAILLTRRDLRPWLAGALFITDFIAEMLAGTPWMMSSIYALILTGDAVLSSWLLLRFVSEPFTFRRIRDLVGWLLLSVIFSNALASLASAAAASRFLPGTSFGDSWKLWMASDGIGNLIVTPLVLSWAAWGRTRVGIKDAKGTNNWDPKRVLEGAVLFTLLALVNYLAFYRLSESGLSSLLLTYLTFPFLLWSALRYGVRGVASASIILAAVSIYSASTGHVTQDLLQGSSLDVIITVQLFLAVMVVPALFLATVISERKQAEEALRESEDKFKYVFDYSNVGKSITLLSGEISVNRAFCKMLGYSPEELRSKKWREITHPDDIELTQREIDTLFSGEKDAVRFNKRYLKKDGSVIWTDLSSSVRRDEAGKPLYFMTTLVDITEYKQVMEALRNSEERFRSIASNTPDHIIIQDRDLRYVFVLNPQLGLTEADMLGKTDKDFLGEVDAEALTIIKRKVLEIGEPVRLEMPVQNLKGETEFFEGSYIPRFDATGKANGLIGYFRNITERKQAEETLQKSESRLRAILDATPFPIALVDVQDNIIDFWSHSALVLFGYTAPNAPEWYQLAYPDPDYRRDVIGRWKPFLEKARLSTQAVNTGEYRVTCRDGSVRICELYAAFRADRLIVTFNDITERLRAEAQIRSLNNELEQRVEERTRELSEAHEQLVRQEKLAVLGQLAGGVGHELRNPLAVINNAIYFLKLIQPDANEKVKEYLGMIDKETHNAEKIISDLLDFARVKSVDCEMVSIHELVQRVLERYPVGTDHRAPASVTVTLDFPPGLPDVYVDPRQIEQVVGNLVVNACQAMPEGGELTISARCEDKDIVIAITDTGVGVSPENIKKLFEPLFTTKAKGIGLGLAVSKKLAEANGGRIEVTSEEGKGSVFTVYLPVYKDIE